MGSVRPEVGRALVKIKSGRADVARALGKIKSGRAEVARGGSQLSTSSFHTPARPNSAYPQIVRFAVFLVSFTSHVG